jgi:hypothetical protein
MEWVSVALLSAATGTWPSWAIPGGALVPFRSGGALRRCVWSGAHATPPLLRLCRSECPC